MTGMADLDEYEEHRAQAYRKNRGRRGSHSLPTTPKSAQKTTFNRASFRSERAHRRYDYNRSCSPSQNYEQELERKIANMTVTEILTRRKLMKQRELVDQASPGSYHESPQSLSGMHSPRHSPITRTAGTPNHGRGVATTYTSHHRRAFSCRDRTRSQRFVSLLRSHVKMILVFWYNYPRHQRTTLHSRRRPPPRHCPPSPPSPPPHLKFI